MITQMVIREEAHIALMELMKWHVEDLKQLYASIVYIKKWNPIRVKLKLTILDVVGLYVSLNLLEKLFIQYFFMQLHVA